MLYANSIPAPSHTHRRAAFRRVAVAVARDARPYHGGLQRFERAGVEETIDKADVGDAAVVVGSGLERVVGYHHLFDSLVTTNMKMSIAGDAPIHYQGWQLSKQIGVCPGIGERKDEFAVCGVEVEKHPVVFDVAVAKPFKVAGKRMVLVLWRQNLSLRKLKDNGMEFVFIFAAPKHFLQVLPKPLRLEDPVFHASRNSLSLAGSSQNRASGEFTSSLASLYASNIRWCLLLRVRAKGMPPTSRILAKKQLKAVDMFMPMSSRMSSTSALSSASVRNVMLVVIVCTPVVRKDVGIISDCAERYKEAA